MNAQQTRCAVWLAALVVCFSYVGLALSANEPDASAKAEGVEEVEEVEVIEEVEVVEPGEVAVVGDDPASAGFTLSKVIGRNHPALVHLPIGFAIAVLFIELLSFFLAKLDMGRSGLVMSGATVAAFIPAVISGFLRSEEVFATREPPGIFFDHRNLMIAGASIFTVSLILRLLKKDQLSGAWRYIYLALLLIAVAVLGAGGHAGGQMVYGEDFLPY